MKIFSLSLLLILFFIFITSSKTNLYNQVNDNNFILARLDNSKVNLEVAKSIEKRHRGLMFRQSMSKDAGMIFIFNDENIRTFHMRNTYLPLDIVFLDSNFNINTIYTNTIPNQSFEVYTSKAPSMYVIELNSGWIQHNNIKLNNKLKVIQIL